MESAFSEAEIVLRDEAAMRILAAILPALPSPAAAASAMPAVFELAEVFVRERRRRDAMGAEEPTASSPLVRS